MHTLEVYGVWEGKSICQEKGNTISNVSNFLKRFTESTRASLGFSPSSVVSRPSLAKSRKLRRRSEFQKFRISDCGIHEQRDLVDLWMIHDDPLYCSEVFS